MEVSVNGEVKQVSARTLAELLASHGIGADAKGVAVALNGVVVPRARWAETAVAPGAQLEIVTARQGG